jgi:hypothetical protein
MNNYNTFGRFNKKNKLCDIITTRNDYPSDGRKDWIKLPNDDINRHMGDLQEWFDESMQRIPDQELVKQGKRKDNCGMWYNPENPAETDVISELDVEPKEGYTKEQPLENEQCQFFDKANNNWIVDVVKKERAEKEKEVVNIQKKSTPLNLKFPLGTGG